MSFIKVYESIPMGKGPTMKIKNACTTIATTFRQSFFCKRKKFMGFIDTNEFVNNESPALCWKAHWLQILNFFFIRRCTQKLSMSFLVKHLGYFGHCVDVVTPVVGV